MSNEENLKSKLKDAVFPRAPKTVAEPEKELRFTRAGQAPVFFFFAVFIFAGCVAVWILSTQDWGIDEPLLKGWTWLCTLGLLGVYALIRLGLRCTRRAYLILNPLGVEIFPFFKAEKNLQIVYWSEVVDAEFTPGVKHLVLHFNKEKKSGVVASLRPIPRKRRHLLEEAILGMMEKRDAEVD